MRVNGHWTGVVGGGDGDENLTKSVLAAEQTYAPGKIPLVCSGGGGLVNVSTLCVI